LVLVLIFDMNNMNKTVIIFLASFAILFANVDPAPPAIPELQIVSGNEEIKLIWDNKAENSIDPLTGYSDFEGYRIYRSTDGGQTWGKSWNRIYDYSGNHVAWKPYVQFDLEAQSDTLHCIYSNAYYDVKNESCYSNAFSYDSLLLNADWLLTNDIINVNNSLVYLPYYQRGNCPEEAHNDHDWDDPHFANDCFNGGMVSEFDPMATWISLGNDVGLKRLFVDTDVLDGVQYTYAVTAFDIGMQSFNVDFLSTASSIANEKCDLDDYYEQEKIDIKPFLEIEGYCEWLPPCYWNVDDGVCQYSDEDYCSGNDSYCDGMECCGAESCCFYDEAPLDGISDYVIDTPTAALGHLSVKEECLSNSLSSNDVYWIPDSTSDRSTCEEKGFIWQDVKHGFEDYSYKEACEADGRREWVVVEYNDEGSCIEVDNDDDGVSDYEWKVVTFLSDTTWSSWNPGRFIGKGYSDSTLWGYPSFESPKLHESFTDYNVNGICDNEPFTDTDSSDEGEDGICDKPGDWTKRCPDILENCKIDSNSDGIINGDDNNCCINVVVVESGYKASNITFPADTPEIDFVVPDANNKGNGTREYNIVNEYDLTDAVLHFEINAGLDADSYGDSSGSFPTKDASLFIYEVTGSDNPAPKETDGWLAQDFTENDIDSLVGLPGVSYNEIDADDKDSCVDGYVWVDDDYGETSEDECGQISIESGEESVWYALADDQDSGNCGDGNGRCIFENISVPNYLIEDFKLLSMDNPLSESNFTDWFYGIQFRFDNGPDRLSYNSAVVLKDLAYSDTSLNNYLDIKLQYVSSGALEKRLMYKYKIEFSTSYIDSSILIAPNISSDQNCSDDSISDEDICDFATKEWCCGTCDDDVANDCLWTGSVCKDADCNENCEGLWEEDETAEFGKCSNCIENNYRGFMSLLPFRVINMDTQNQLKIQHSDKGTYQGSLKFGDEEKDTSCPNPCDIVTEHCINRSCVKKIGYKDCLWEGNEVITLTDTVFTTDEPEGVSEFVKEGVYKKNENVFHLKIDFNFPEYALSHEPDYYRGGYNTTEWDWISGRAYEIYNLIYYEGMLYRANMEVSDDNPPNKWFDDDGDDINDNVWQILYPWEDGDFVVIEPYGWYQDGDTWVADLSTIGELDNNNDDDLDNISVVPNPYIVNSGYFNESPGNHLIRFTRLPSKCTISIYTVSGEFVAQIDHDDPFSGNEWWNIKNGARKSEPVAPGLYIYVVDTPGGKSKMGKFAIVR